jgi:TPR repeat protein
MLAMLLAAGRVVCGPFEDGMAARERGDYAAAFGAFKPLAASGDANSQFQLSLLYATGGPYPCGFPAWLLDSLTPSIAACMPGSKAKSWYQRKSQGSTSLAGTGRDHGPDHPVF